MELELPDSRRNCDPYEDQMTAFTPTDRSKVKRLHERGRYDEESVFAISMPGSSPTSAT
jgi:hypothetical protein